MKEKTKRTKTNKPICSKNNNEHVGAGLVPAHNKGITLIALILTIIVLLILAVVAISAVTGNGIIAHAKNSRDLYGTKSEEENALLQNYLEQINKEINGGSSSSGDNKEADGITVKGSLNKIISTTANTPLTDDFGNKITVPAGFKILADSTTSYTAETIDVTKGIVVEDEEENQFVWIPVGEIKNSEKTKVINLERNTFGDSNVTLATFCFKNIRISRLKNNYKTTTRSVPGKVDNDEITVTEGRKTDTTENEHAKDIEDFISKTNASGGYYIGRYEARTRTERNSETDDDNLTPVTSKANDYVYNYVTQVQASKIARNMYINKSFESDLVNSYAWDTAIIFFQEFGGNSTYASKTSVNSSLAKTGTSGTSYTGTKDTICNVYDMASNCEEWSTETYSNSGLPCTKRSDYYDCINCTSLRSRHDTTGAGDSVSFRPLLYM